MAAIAASSISTPGAITLELPGSSRWDTTTARREFRAASSRGSRPYGAKARQDRPSARGAFHPGSRPRSGSPAQVCSRPPQHERESFFECHDRLRILQSLLGARGRRDSSCLREIAPETTNLAVRSSNLFGRAHSVRSCSPNLADTVLNHATRSSRASPIRPMPGRRSYIGFVQGAKSGIVILANSTKCPVTRVGTQILTALNGQAPGTIESLEEGE